MTRYLTTEQTIRIARHATGAPVEVRDLGLLDAAVHRPRASVLGRDAYPDLPTKAAALLQSLARNHPLVDGAQRDLLHAPALALGAPAQRLGLRIIQAEGHRHAPDGIAVIPGCRYASRGS